MCINKIIHQMEMAVGNCIIIISIPYCTVYFPFTEETFASVILDESHLHEPTHTAVNRGG